MLAPMFLLTNWHLGDDGVYIMLATLTYQDLFMVPSFGWIGPKVLVNYSECLDEK